MPGKYVAVIFDDETQKKLREYCQANGFDITKNHNDEDINTEDFQFHCTIIYTDNQETPDLTVGDDYEIDGEAEALDFKILGKNKHVLTLEIDSDEIMELRDMVEEFGVFDEWPEYIPHVTLSYAWGVEEEPDEDIDLPDFPLTFSKMTISNVHPKEAGE